MFFLLLYDSLIKYIIIEYIIFNISDFEIITNKFKKFKSWFLKNKTNKNIINLYIIIDILVVSIILYKLTDNR